MIKPIDLQTLFIKMNDVGKEQVNQKELSNVQQALEAAKQVKKEIDRDHSVNETAEEKESDAIRDKEEQETRKGNRRNKEKKEGGDKDDAEDQPEKASDPEVGRHIDITG
jgi:hypothetical protein